jgi:hypothetical protein
MVTKLAEPVRGDSESPRGVQGSAEGEAVK